MKASIKTTAINAVDAMPLVSVVAISYNQSNWVIESLNSVLNQDYKNIELIICDDCSTDGTIGLIECWLHEHGSRFFGVRLLTNYKNEGICRNVARGLAAASGSWIKGLACDDILHENAVSMLLEQAELDGTELVFSQITKFRCEGIELHTEGNLLTSEKKIDLIKEHNCLFESILRENFLPAPSAFYSRRLFEASGGIDTNYKHLDDWPLWLQMLPLVNRVSWIDKPLILYRLNESSVSQNKKTSPISGLMYPDINLFYKKIQRPQLPKLERWHMDLRMLRRYLTFETFGNTWLAYRLLLPLQALSPLSWKNLVKKICSA